MDFKLNILTLGDRIHLAAFPSFKKDNKKCFNYSCLFSSISSGTEQLICRFALTTNPQEQIEAQVNAVTKVDMEIKAW